jgi:hypothetical protein
MIVAILMAILSIVLLVLSASDVDEHTRTIARARTRTRRSRAHEYAHEYSLALYYTQGYMSPARRRTRTRTPTHDDDVYDDPLEYAHEYTLLHEDTHAHACEYAYDEWYQEDEDTHALAQRIREYDAEDALSEYVDVEYTLKAREGMTEELYRCDLGRLPDSHGRRGRR